MTLIKRDDAIEAVCRTRCGDKAKGCPAHSCLVIEEFDALQSAETHEIRTETHGVCLISKDDAIKAIRKCKFESVMPSDWYIGMECAQDIVKTLPSAEAYFTDGNKIADWIPVSERLPEDSGDYLVCPSNGVIEDYSDCRDVMIMPYDADCEAFGWWTERYDPISLGFVDSDFNEFEVLAWMPLPKPYKGGEE